MAVALAVFCVQLDAFALNTALPRIAADLVPDPTRTDVPGGVSGGRPEAGGGGGVAGARWVVSGYLLAAGSLMVGAGRLGDLWGLRRMVLCGLALFGAASVGCAVATGLPTLVAARVAQGVGAACLMPCGLALLTSVYPPALRGRATGWAFGLGGVATACGPFVGGVLTQALSWRAVFWLSVPLTACAALALWAARDARRAGDTGDTGDAGDGRVVREAAVRTAGGGRGVRGGRGVSGGRGVRERWDWPGLAAATVALAALGLFADRVRVWGWASGASAATLAACGAALALFARRRRRAAAPLVDPALTRDGRYVVLTASGAVANAATVVFLFVVPQALQGRWGLAAGASGLAFLAPATAMAVAGVVAGRVGVPRAVPVMAGCLAAGAVALGGVAAAGSLPLYLCATTAAGAALGLAGALTLTATQAAVPPRHAGAASGVTKTVVTVAGGLGVALTGPGPEPGAAPPTGHVPALAAALACAVTATALTVRLHTPPRSRRPRD
ncbi:MFS transporter [Streptomyces sp. NPDC057702]|uniref:MFS transporter n=1 Tax=unclassified Streptomyces TaxID=2593676 RepID=UPI0036CBCE20